MNESSEIPGEEEDDSQQQQQSPVVVTKKSLEDDLFGESSEDEAEQQQISATSNVEQEQEEDASGANVNSQPYGNAGEGLDESMGEQENGEDQESPVIVERNKSSIAHDLFGSDDDDEQPIQRAGQGSISASKLFDEDDDEDAPNDLFRSDEAAAGTTYDADVARAAQEEEYGEDEAMEEEEQEPEPEKPIISIDAIMVDTPGPKDSPDLFLLKLPPFMSIDHVPFTPATYIAQKEGKIPTTATTTNKGGDSIMQNENCVRWRYPPSGGGVPESNARIVRWSDGSFSLLIGKNTFSINSTDVSSRNLFMTTPHQAEGFLHTQARFRRVMNFIPSEATQDMVGRIAVEKFRRQREEERKKGGAKAELYTILQDPQKKARDAEKAQEEIMKAKRKLENAKLAELSREYRGGDMMEQEVDNRKRPRASGGRRTGRNLDEYEDDEFVERDDEERYGYAEEEEEEMESDDEAASNRLLAAKRSTGPANPPDLVIKSSSNGSGKGRQEADKKSKRLRVIEDSDSD